MLTGDKTEFDCILYMQTVPQIIEHLKNKKYIAKPVRDVKLPERRMIREVENSNSDVCRIDVV
jgi:hypothetical protein